MLWILYIWVLIYVYVLAYVIETNVFVHPTGKNTVKILVFTSKIAFIDGKR